MTSKLRDLSPSHIQDQSRTLTSKILSLPSFVQSKNVSCYLSMPSGEFDTSMLVREILRSGKSLFVPRIDKTVDGRMDFLQIHSEDDLNSLPAGVWGIKEPDLSYNDKPRANADEAGLDLILLPGLAFDRSSSRLGHGKGYYDRFITAYTQNDRAPPLLVGLALREQLLNSNTIPTASHDWKMDCIVTDKEYIHRN
ncbi:5-formyltetrahydrofolate cyclo-ligase [Favolaschia claudopus]|uniref:5-formyltetrahydrofolate cyclo-ligase n=1 Tax=Favolaschia claudopus TaxID=2862362 RepID=A0AAW0D1M0_9AGAR